MIRPTDRYDQILYQSRRRRTSQKRVAPVQQLYLFDIAVCRNAVMITARRRQRS